MRLVIEREGGFTVVEDADAITEIDVRNDAVVLTIEVGGDKWTTTIPVADHAEACRLSAAIAKRCGELVEPLAKGPETVKASEWVEGEPPRDGRWYVVTFLEDLPPMTATWCVKRGAWMSSDGSAGNLRPEAHLPTPIPNQ